MQPTKPTNILSLFFNQGIYRLVSPSFIGICLIKLTVRLGHQMTLFPLFNGQKLKPLFHSLAFLFLITQLCEPPQSATCAGDVCCGLLHDGELPSGCRCRVHGWYHTGNQRLPAAPPTFLNLPLRGIHIVSLKCVLLEPISCVASWYRPARTPPPPSYTIVCFAGWSASCCRSSCPVSTAKRWSSSAWTESTCHHLTGPWQHWA